MKALRALVIIGVFAGAAWAQLGTIPNESGAQFRTDVNAALSRGVANTGSYTNPAWLVSIPYTKVTGLGSTGPITFSSGIFGCAVANGTTAGCLSSTDWATFNGKQNNLGFTPLNASANLSDVVTPATARNNLGLGTIATKAATSGAAIQKADTAGGLTPAAFGDIVSLFSGCSGIQYLGADGACHTPATGSGTGTVQSVGLSLPSWLTVSGSPITTSGTLAVTTAGGQTANQFLATPNGPTGAVTLRSIVAADIPVLNQNTTGTAAALASNGTNCPAGSFALGVDASGNAEGCTVAAGSGTVQSVTLASTPSWLSVNNPTVTTTGTITLNAAGGLPPNQILATPNISNGAVALRPMVAGDLPTIPLATGVSGTLQAAQEPAHTGDVTGSAGSLALNVAAISGVAVPGNTGSGNVVRAISPTLTSPALGTVASGDISAVTGTANSVTSGITKALKSATTAVDVSLATAPTGGQVLTAQDSTHAVWQTITGTGTVQSVGLTVPSFLSVAGSPITGSGTLAVTTATGQTANQVLATPNGATGAAVLRALVPADVPVLNQNTTGTATNVTGVVAIANGGTGATTATGTGIGVLNNSPTLVTPVLGAATATSVNKVSITQPTTGSTLTIADGKALAANNSLTLTGTDGSSVAFGAGGTAAYTGNNLGAFASTTSAQLAGVISDETGSGAVVLATNPVLVTPNLGTPSAAVMTNATGTATGFTSGATNALKSATTTVDVVAAAAPSSGQVLTATDGTHATWLTPSGGGGGGGGISAVNAQTGTTYTVLNSDCGKLLTFSNASSVAVTLPQAGGGGSFAATCSIRMVDLGAGTVTVTPTTSLINGASPYALTTGQGALLVSDGTNYIAQNGKALGAGSLNTQLDGALVGSGVSALNILTGPDMTPTLTQAGSVASLQYAPNGARWATRDQVQSGTDRFCSPSSSSSSAYTCIHAHPLTAYTSGMTQVMRFDVGGSGGAITVAMDGLGTGGTPSPKRIFGPDGTTNLTTGQSAAGTHGVMIYDGALDSGNGGWRFQTGGTSSSSGGGGAVYAADTSGAANQVTIAPSPAVTYTAGTQIVFKAANTNTGPVNIAANGLTNHPLRTTLGNALPAGAISAGGEYLVVDDGTQYQLVGTANCVMTATGISCNSVSSSSITMGGSTSGQTTYVGPAVGASATYRLAGYSSTTNPTAGNCMQWASISGNLVAGDSGSACGSGSGSAGIDMTTFSKTILPSELGYDQRGIFYSALCDGGPTSWVSTAGEPGVGIAVSGTGNCFASWPSNSSNQHPMKDFASGGTPRTWTVVSRYAKAATTVTNTASDFFPMILNSVNSGTFATSLGIRWNHTTATYQCYIRSGGTDVVATTVAGTSDSLEHTFKIYNNGTANSLSCSVDGGTVTTVSGTVPTSDWFISSGIVGLSGTTEFSFSEIRVLITGLAR